ncbi:MAG: DUF2442 domain-containing protein [Lachnospiraceae bacterium]|nr:DUF2442 domain-containing protein [Lachnospiraceae bacterium]
MLHKIYTVKTKDNFILEAVFFDGTVREYDVSRLFSLYPQMKALEDQKLFSRVQVDAGNYGVSWNDELDLDAETIWEDGVFLRRESTSVMLQVAVNLSKAREKAGLTQKQLAERTGIYQADISKIERGLGNPSVSTLRRLAEGLDLELKIEFKGVE